MDQLKNSVNALTQELANIKSSLPNIIKGNQHSDIATPHQLTAQQTARLPNSLSHQNDQQSRKNNVIVYGLPECTINLPRLQRIKKDLDKTTTLFNKIDSDISRSSIRECFRLGQYKSNSEKPRPILAKLNSTDVISLLAYRGELPEGVKIKPDLSPQERLCESLLLKERWKLIQAGTDRRHIKIRRSSLIVSGKVHAEVVNNILKFASTPNEPSSVVMDIEDQGDKRSEGSTSQPSNTNA